jgi:hypothetical protein
MKSLAQETFDSSLHWQADRHGLLGHRRNPDGGVPSPGYNNVKSPLHGH